MRTPSLEQVAVRVANRALRTIRSIPALRRMYYRNLNEQTFSTIYAHDSMLADRVRMESYARAIDTHIQPGMVVIDVGTGSGVLACLAAQRGAQVHALEHAAIIEHARMLAKANGLADRITFHHMHSRDLELPGRVDAILHEQIGLNLVDENMVENILSLRDRLLKPRGLILPAHFELYADPVELRADLVVPYSWEHQFHGLDFRCFRPEVLPWTIGQGQDKRMLEPGDVAANLAPEQRVLTLDLQTRKRGALQTDFACDGTLERSGRLDGFALYFKIGFDDAISFKTGPGHLRTHWASRLLRTEAREVRAGQRIAFHLHAADVTDAERWTWGYTVR
jgi:ubiquinone/menaquinone biosynthesis C-methylase UbiE